MTVIITGGTKGIGLAIAERVARPGERLVLAYRDDETAAREAAARLAPTEATVITVRANIGEVEGAAKLMDASAGGDDLVHLVHSAAMIYPTTLLDADLGKFTNAVHVNGLSLLYLVQKALPLLSRGSSIVFITSAGARLAQANYAALGVGKALAESLVRYFVQELAPKGIRINAVAPGLVATTSVAAMVGGEAAAANVLERWRCQCCCLSQSG